MGARPGCNAPDPRAPPQNVHQLVQPCISPNTRFPSVLENTVGKGGACLVGRVCIGVPINPARRCSPCIASFPRSHFFAGCWISILYPGFYAPLYRKVQGNHSAAAYLACLGWLFGYTIYSNEMLTRRIIAHL
jgi:hypothetical protein